MKEYKIERIIAELQNMAQNEILNLMSAGQYNRIKAMDEHPEFRVYAVGVEGEAHGNLLSRKEIGTQHWFKSAIRKIADKVKEGVQFFNLHAKGTNSTEGRTPIGEVVGKGLKSIGDKLNALVVAYIYPEFRKEKLDVASIETNVSLSIDNGVAKVDDVEDITGIALGNSAVATPGFAGATLQGAFQAFEAELQNSGKENTMKTKEEILAAIKEANLNPTSLFGEEILKDDATVKSMVKTAITGEYEHRKRTDKAFDDARADWEKEKKELTDKNKTLEVDKTKLQVGDVLATMITDRKLDEKQSAYVTSRLPQFNITEPEKVKDELDKFVDNQLKAYDIDTEIITGKKKEEAKKPEEKKEDETSEVSDENLDPEKNDMIPETHKKEG